MGEGMTIQEKAGCRKTARPVCRAVTGNGKGSWLFANPSARQLPTLPKRLRGPAEIFPGGRPRGRPAPTNPFFCSGFCEGAYAARRNTACIYDGDAQSEQDSLQEKGVRGPAFRKILVIS